jgi:S-DNA-T family DNA segregation ATPase FtsK/SpoIIIE
VLAVLREGRALGVHCVFTARQVTTGLHALAAACEARLLLRLADAQEHVAAGGERSAFEPALPAGGGHWRGHRLQIVSAPSPGSPTVVPTEQLDLARHRVTAIVSTAPAALAARFEDDSRLERLEPAGRQGRAEHGVTASGRSLPIGDPDDWQSHLALLAAAKAEGAVLFHGCAPADLRALTGRRILPPPLATAESCWLLEPGGIVSRVRLPQAPRTSATGV